jgi:hypothetical protein
MVLKWKNLPYNCELYINKDIIFWLVLKFYINDKMVIQALDQIIGSRISRLLLQGIYYKNIALETLDVIFCNYIIYVYTENSFWLWGADAPAI